MILHTGSYPIHCEVTVTNITLSLQVKVDEAKLLTFCKGLDCLVHLMLTVPITINPEQSLQLDPGPGPSSTSAANQVVYWLSTSLET